MKGVLVLFGLLKYLKLSSAEIDELYAVEYLRHYGYMDINSETTPAKPGYLTARTVSEALVDFQRFNNLRVTGELDEDTKKIMKLPKCDVANRGDKRFVLIGDRWHKKKLTYEIKSYPEVMSKQEIDAIIKRAFKTWTRYADIEIDPVCKEKRADFNIRFAYGTHGDAVPFDGPSGNLAHASNPAGGDIHFDASELWTDGSNMGFNLYTVAVHEIGHALGLDHTNSRNSVMYPYYSGYNGSSILDQDDKDAIQSLYGRKVPKDVDYDENTQKCGNEEVNKDGLSTKILCDYPKPDAIFEDSNNVTYVFQNTRYWTFKNAVSNSYARIISSQWVGIPDYIDTAFTDRTHNIYIFKGSQYWKYNYQGMPDSKNPKAIQKGFPGIPNDIDAAFSLTNGTTYFFKGPFFWKFDPTQRPPVTHEYPKAISEAWRNVPNYLDAVLHASDGQIYFFKDDEYYRWDNEMNAVNPSYPKNTKYGWFGCSAESWVERNIRKNEIEKFY